MSWAGVIVTGLVAAMVLFQLRIYLQSKGMVGKKAPTLAETDPDVGETGSLELVYFHSPRCGPCRRMSPLIDGLAERYGNVTRVDISQDREAARKYHVRATPTTILVEDGVISKVLLGPQSEKTLEGLLQQ